MNKKLAIENMMELNHTIYKMYKIRMLNKKEPTAQANLD